MANTWIEFIILREWICCAWQTLRCRCRGFNPTLDCIPFIVVCTNQVGWFMLGAGYFERSAS